MDSIKIFDAFLSFSDLAQRIDERRKLNQQNLEIKMHCGSCALWMTQQCKREASGRKITCGDITCDEFSMKKSHADLIIKNEQRIKELTKEINTR